MLEVEGSVGSVGSGSVEGGGSGSVGSGSVEGGGSGSVGSESVEGGGSGSVGSESVEGGVSVGSGSVGERTQGRMGEKETRRLAPKALRIRNNMCCIRSEYSSAFPTSSSIWSSGVSSNISESSDSSFVSFIVRPVCATASPSVSTGEVVSTRSAWFSSLVADALCALRTFFLWVSTTSGAGSALMTN